MTNGEAFKKVIPDLVVEEVDEDIVCVYSPSGIFLDDFVEIDANWWNDKVEEKGGRNKR